MCAQCSRPHARHEQPRVAASPGCRSLQRSIGSRVYPRNAPAFTVWVRKPIPRHGCLFSESATSRGYEAGTPARPRSGTRGHCRHTPIGKFAGQTCPRMTARVRGYMVRRGSTVRVRQRALENASKWRFLLPRHITTVSRASRNLSPRSVPKAQVPAPPWLEHRGRSARSTSTERRCSSLMRATTGATRGHDPVAWGTELRRNPQPRQRVTHSLSTRLCCPPRTVRASRQPGS